MSIGQVQALCAFLAATSLVLTIAVRQRRIGHEDVGRIFVAFGAGGSIPIAIFLCSYGFYPDPPNVVTKLRHYELYVSAAGLTLLLTGTIALGTLFLKAALCEKQAAEEVRQSTTSS